MYVICILHTYLYRYPGTVLRHAYTIRSEAKKSGPLTTPHRDKTQRSHITVRPAQQSRVLWMLSLERDRALTLLATLAHIFGCFQIPSTCTCILQRKKRDYEKSSTPPHATPRLATAVWISNGEQRKISNSLLFRCVNIFHWNAYLD